jgi:hypothetical protein
MKRLALLAVALVLPSLVLQPAGRAAEASPKHVRLLAIGNSFSGNATHDLPGIVEAAGDKLTFKTISIGGCPLQKHWANAEAFQRGSTNATARAWEALASEKWDFVTLQQYSMDSYKAETYRPFAKQLFDYIRAKVPTAEVVFHETWAYREDDPLFKGGFTQRDMYWKLREAYETVAGELGCRIIPVGDAFQNARSDPSWKGVFPDPSFDYKNPRPPALPDQTHSLNGGYTWLNGTTLKYDGHHANASGSYLAAAVWYEFLFGHSVVGNAFVPRNVSAADVAILQRIAHQTVAEGLKPKK